MSKLINSILKKAQDCPEYRKELLASGVGKTAGGDYFQDYGEGTDPDRIFRYLQQEARSGYGSRGYTGTIAEKPGYEIRSRTPMSQAEASDFMETDGDDNDKWGDAYAIPVVESKIVGQKELTVQVRATNKREAYALGLEALKKRRGRKAKGVSVSARIKDVTQASAGSGAQIELRRVPGGKAYYSVAGVRYGGGKFDSKVEASTAARKELSRDGVEVGREVRIVKSVLMGTLVKTGEGKKKAAWEITGVQTVSKMGTKIKGWYFYGVASS